MNKKQILVFDDNYSRASKWVSELEALKAVSSFLKVESSGDVRRVKAPKSL